MADTSFAGSGKRRVRRRFHEAAAATGGEVRQESCDVERGSDGADQVQEVDTETVPAETKQKRPSRFNDEPADIQKYKRTAQELKYLERKISKFGWNNISAKDRNDYSSKQQLLKLLESKERLKQAIALNETSVDTIMEKPNDKRSKQVLWEEQVLKNAVTSKDGIDDIYVADADKYEYVFDKASMVEFTSDNELLYSSDEEEDTENPDEETSTASSIEEAKRKLPVFQYRTELMKSVKSNSALIIVGETGSGKTTQLPQYLVEDGYTKGNKFQIAVTQPRRVAATSVAARVAQEMNVKLGEEVGYSIRFDDKTTTEKTILKYVTDGMLLRECLTDPMLSKYSCVMIDEAHERTIATDILLGLLKRLLAKRNDLKVIISSATVNAEKFSEFFNNCPIINIPGRRFPVDIHYTLQPEGNYINASITTVFQIHTTQPLEGDILLFLTGQEEIETTKENVEQILGKLGSRIPPLIITPIYANLPQDQQQAIFQPTPKGCRKLVLATNIAETSLTINGIRYVIDPGFVKENSYVPNTGMTQLLTVPCSKASVNQRAGRAGRTGPGKCFRLFTKLSYEKELELMPKPEILRTNLSNIVLLLLSLGVTDLLNFPFLDKPSIPALSKSLENLYTLGALNSKGQITDLGRMMCEFPCEPEMAKVLYTAATHEKCSGVLEPCLTIVAMLHETTSLFIGNKREAMSRIVSETDSDTLLYLETYRAWRDANYSRLWCQDHKVQFKTMLRVRNIRNQLSKCCDKLGLSKINNANIGKNKNINAGIICSFISGFPSNIVKLTSSGYTTMGKKNGGITVNIHPSSVVFYNYKEKGQKPAKYVLYQQLMLTSKEFIRDCTPISNEAWLVDMVPHIFQSLITAEK